MAERLHQRLFAAAAGPGAAMALAAWAACVGSDFLSDAAIAPSGGAEFRHPVDIPVCELQQSDARWANLLLGPTAATIAQEGCALASAAMVLRFFGVPTDPAALNEFLRTHPRGFTPNGWIYWEAAEDITGAGFHHAYEGPPRHRLIDRNLARANPVIARIRRPSGATHFVVIRGKDGPDYLVNDPGAARTRRLADLATPLEAIRFYLPGKRAK